MLHNTVLVSAAQQHGSFESKNAFSKCVYLVLKGSVYGKQTALPPRHCMSFRLTQPCLDSVLPLPGSFLPFLSRDASHRPGLPGGQRLRLGPGSFPDFCGPGTFSKSGQLGREGGSQVAQW